MLALTDSAVQAMKGIVADSADDSGAGGMRLKELQEAVGARMARPRTNPFPLVRGRMAPNHAQRSDALVTVGLRELAAQTTEPEHTV